MSVVASRLRLVTASWLAVAALSACLGACQGPDPFARHLVADGGAAGATTYVGAAGMPGGDDGAADSTAVNAPCTTCMVRVSYTCRSLPTDRTQRSFIVDVTNESSATLSLANLTLRYWYEVTADEQGEQVLDCDTAKIGCTNVVTSANGSPSFVPVMPPKDRANEYAEIAFTLGALSLDPTLDTGEIQLRVHDKIPPPLAPKAPPLDDYSLDCAMMGNAVDNEHITAYVDDVLVWGLEPGKPNPDGGT